MASPDLDLPRGTDFWFNLRTSPKEDGHSVTGIARLRQGATMIPAFRASRLDPVRALRSE